MSEVLNITAVLPGILAGFIVVKLIVHWALLLLAGLGRAPDNASLPQRSKPNWPLLFAVIHPVPWLLLLGVPYGISRLVLNPPAAGWLWFLGGTALSVIATWLSACVVTRRSRSRAAAKTDSTI